MSYMRRRLHVREEQTCACNIRKKEAVRNIFQIISEDLKKIVVFFNFCAQDDVDAIIIT